MEDRRKPDLSKIDTSEKPLWEAKGVIEFVTELHTHDGLDRNTLARIREIAVEWNDNKARNRG